MKKKNISLVRLNSRVKPGHLAFVKAEAKRLKVSEGEANRIIIDFYIKNKK